VPLAEAGFRCWVPDQRGYNLSDKPIGVAAYHIDILARDIISLIISSGREKAIIIGHDWGAAVAWHLATNSPERVEKLGILNVPHPAVMARTLRSSLSQLLKSWYMFAFQIPWLPEWVLGWNNAQGISNLLRRSGKPTTFTEEDLSLYRAACSRPGALTAMINWYRSTIRSRFGNTRILSPGLPRITMPVLMIWGVQDMALNHEMAKPSIDLCDDGRLVFLEDATHWVQHDEANEVTRLLLDFITETHPGC